MDYLTIGLFYNPNAVLTDPPDYDDEDDNTFSPDVDYPDIEVDYEF